MSCIKVTFVKSELYLTRTLNKWYNQENAVILGQRNSNSFNKKYIYFNDDFIYTTKQFLCFLLNVLYDTLSAEYTLTK